MYRRALVSIALVAIAVMAAGGAAVALLGSASADEALVAEDVLFDVGEAGSVIVTSDGSDLRVVSVSTADGWGHRIAREGGSSVNVVFSAAGLGIDFHAVLDEASIVGRIRIVAAPSEGTPVPAEIDTVEAAAPESAALEPASEDEPFEDTSSPAVQPTNRDQVLQQEPAAPEPATAIAGPGDLGLAYGKITGETPIIDPVLDTRPRG